MFHLYWLNILNWFMAEMQLAYNSFLIDFLIAPKYRVARHVVLVLFFTFVAFNLPYLISAEYTNKEGHMDDMVVYTSIFLLVSYLAGVYLHLYVLLPKLLLKDRVMLYVVTVGVLLVAMLAVSFAADAWLNHYYDEPPGFYSYFYKGRRASVEIVGNYVLYALLLAGTSLTLLLREWLQFNKRKNELEKINLKTELEGLKDRINPEFLFSMLDEASEQTAGNPELASLVLMKLSRLLRYQLYDGNREKVLLISEISFIENFLDLARVRYPNLNFNVMREGDVSRNLVPPLLFIPFAIRYVKLLTAKDQAMDLRFNFRVEPEGIGFSCICFTPGLPECGMAGTQELADVKQRLDLLFPDAYRLTTSGDSSLCKTDLYLKL